MANAAIAHGVGRYVVGNVLNNTVDAYRVYQASAPNNLPGPHQLSALAQHIYEDDGNITTTEVAAFSSLVSYYNLAPVGYQKQINLHIVAAGQAVGIPTALVNYKDKTNTPSFASKPAREDLFSPMAVPVPGGGSISYPYPGTNAYTVVNGGTNQNNLLSWLSHTVTFHIDSIIDTAINALSTFHLTDVSHAPATAFTIYFQDGSHIGAYVDNTKNPPQLVVDQTSAVDYHGNNIPAKKTDVAGTGVQQYNFDGVGNNGDRPNMGQQIYLLGVAPPDIRVTNFLCFIIFDGSTQCVKAN